MSHYEPVESRRYRGWYEIPTVPGALASKDGKLMRLNRLNITEGVSDGFYKKTYVEGTYIYVHRYVCLAFWGEPPKDGKVYFVNHKDGNKLNNYYTNLEWTTISENTKHGWKFRKEKYGLEWYDY